VKVPASISVPTVIVTLFEANEEVEETDLTLQKVVAGVTLVINASGNVSVICPPLVNRVEVEKVTVAVCEFPTEREMTNADAATIVTAPTAGVSMSAGTVSTDVEIFIPALVACFAVSLRPLHVKVTDPAETSELTVIVITSEAYDDEEAALGLGFSSQNDEPLGTLSTNPAGNVKRIFSLLLNLVEVVNVIEAV